MSTERKRCLVAVAEYLEAEEDGTTKHEYVEGFVYAMSGAKIAHNIVATNILGTLSPRLRGRPCRPFNSDTKVRLQLPSGIRFYYPDAQVVCKSNPQDEVFQDQPVAVFEVISRSTRRVDEGEKKDAYLMIPSLVLYVLVEVATPQLTAYRRSERGFVREEYDGLDAVLPVPELKIELPLSEIFDGVDFRARAPGGSRSRSR